VGDTWNPLGEIEDALSEAYDTFVDPVVDEVTESIDNGLTLLETVGAALVDIAGDALAAVGLDPEHLAADWSTLTDPELQAVLDFLNAAGELAAQLPGLETRVAQAQATYHLSLQEKMSAPVVSIFVALKHAIQVVMTALREVLNALKGLIELLSGLGIEEAVNSVDPRFSDWLQGKELPAF
jgi:hypothetical protein